MGRALLNFWLDVILLVTFTVGMWAAAVIRVCFPPGTVAHGWKLWGFSFDQWWDFQFAVQCLFAFAVLLHVMLHWTWVCGIITSRMLRGAQGKRQWSDGERTLFGVGVLVVLMLVTGIPLAAAMFTVQNP